LGTPSTRSALAARTHVRTGAAAENVA
jgi:hypothetical protein